MGTIIGYARVSTLEQKLQAQHDELTAAGCTIIHDEKASSKAGKARPVLARLVRGLREGDTLVVTRMDRIARSIINLLQIIHDVKTKGASFRSIHDPVDTTTSAGMLSLHVLAAVAEFERRIIVDRTLSGLAAARARGRIGGNPKLRSKDKEAQRAVQAAREDRWLERMLEDSHLWLPTVRRMRPEASWREVMLELNAELPRNERWTGDRLRRLAKRMVHLGQLDATVLLTSNKRRGRLTIDTLNAVVGLKTANKDITLEEMSRILCERWIPTPSGRKVWSPSSTAHALNMAERMGLYRPEPAEFPEL